VLGAEDRTELKLKISIDRAISLLGSERDYGKYVCLKIAPEAGGCCCFHCWPHTWQEVNRAILPSGPIKDEGDVVIKTKDGDFVLECHESGPEIIVYLGAATAGLLLIKAIVELITTILKSKSEEPRRRLGKLVITKRTFKGSRRNEERIIEIDLPPDSHYAKILTAELKSMFAKDKKPNKRVSQSPKKTGSG
jgi:hypothetical protein